MPLPTFNQSELEPYVDQAKLSSLYDKYIAQGLPHLQAIAYANAEMGGLTDMQMGGSAVTPTLQSMATAYNPATGQREPIWTQGQHDRGTSTERALMAAAAIAGGAMLAPAAGAGGAAEAGAAAAGATGATEAAIAEGLSAGAPFTGAGAAGATGAGTAALGAESLTALAGAGAATGPLGGLDNAAVSGADYSGAAEAGLSAGALGGGALGASSLSSMASSGGGGGGGSSAGGGGTAGAGAGGGIFGDLADDDWLRILARGAPGLLGALGSASQAEDFEDLAHQYQQMGAPYRGRLEQLYGDPTAFLNSPEVRQPIQQGTDMLARSLSVKGNPAGSGNALQELQNYTSNQLFGRLGQEKDRLGGFGGLTQYNQAAPTMAANTIGAQGNIYSNLGGAAADIFNPQRRFTLQDLLGY